jgi:hypothetical protein
MQTAILVKLTNILLSDKIIAQVRKWDPKIDTSEFQLSSLPSGFGLGKMENMMGIPDNEFYEILRNEPVELDYDSGSGMYNIRNGRHRIARSIIVGDAMILAKIVGTR